ncbi:MAG: FG-GAP-like repeat-containing protein [Verrucomicrobiia bacterium]
MATFPLIPQRDRLRVFRRRAGALRHFVLGLCLFGLMGAEGRSQESGNPAGVTSRPLAPGAPGTTGFIRLEGRVTGLIGAKQTDIDVEIPDQAANAGLAAGDFDGDGLCDLFLCGLDGENFLYRNRGDWKFADVTVASGLKLDDWALRGAVFADVDGDADLDLLVFSLAERNALFLNDGQGKFLESSKIEWSPRNGAGNISGALADVDGDGDLDLYVTSYGGQRMATTPQAAEHERFAKLQIERHRAGAPLDPDFARRFEILDFPNGDEIEYIVEQKGTPDSLYLNDGKGGFRAVADEEGRFMDEDGRPIPLPWDWGLAAQFRDVDNDGDPDLYVSNDFYSPDRFWLNDGRGFFRAVDRLALRRTSVFSMAVDFADINRDGYQDFFTVDMLSRRHTQRKVQMGPMKPTPIRIGEIDNRAQVMQNALFVNRGDGTYAEIAQYAGVKASEWSWGSLFLDVDLDGYEDLIVASGMIRDYMDADINAKIDVASLASAEERKSNRSLFPKLATQNFIFHNGGNLQFSDRSREWGFGMEAVSGGVITADFDNDGDLDVAINNMDREPEIYRNDTTAPRVAVRLKGKAPNTQAVGARIRLSGGSVEQTHEVLAGGHFASGGESLRVFAAGDEGRGLKLEVLWRSGKRTLIENVIANRIYEIDESGAKAFEPTKTPKPDPYFVDVSERLDHRHFDAPFDDFARQSLLPNRLSQLGPGVAWHDLDDDGDDDLIIGTGASGRMAIYLNDGKGGFENQGAPQMPVDQAGVVGWNNQFFVGVSNFETGSSEHFSAQGLGLQSGGRWQFGQSLGGDRSSAGPIVVGDVDGDGDLDLFVGGRSIPGRYPEAADSRLFVNRDGKLELDVQNRKVFQGVGLVSGAVIGDLDGDGDQDLVLACEWGPVKVFRNERGIFSEATRDVGLSGYAGWWNGVTLGDFDGDGRLDIAASNWGRNSKYEHAYSALRPLEIYYRDFDANGTLDIVEAHFDKEMNCLVPERGYSCSTHAMPFIGQKLSSYRAFGVSPLQNILGKEFDGAKVVRANTLAHTVFFNRGSKFEAKELPIWSQLAPAFGINVGDFNGDGNEDLFLSQNFFAVQIETPRNDGGRGLWLEGDGKGGFREVKGQDSGVKIYGEQRGSALSDFDGDGRVDLVVTQNGSQTKLYRNTRGKPGLRVKLRGSVGNTRGVGAIMRLEYADGRLGPARAVLGGSGYWSQDSLTQIVSLAGTPRALVVTWPNGSKTRTTITEETREIRVSQTPVAR